MTFRSIVLIATVAVLALGAANLVPAAGPAVPDESNGGSSYIGEKACKKCHFKQHKTWKGMKHAAAWDVLEEKFRDPAEVDGDGNACISCHVTGWGKADAGGFVNATESEHLLGVQCEACHGPGSLHAEQGKVMLEEKRKHYEPGEETNITLRTTACSTCHNPHISHAEYSDG